MCFVFELVSLISQLIHFLFWWCLSLLFELLYLALESCGADKSFAASPVCIWDLI